MSCHQMDPLDLLQGQLQNTHRLCVKDLATFLKLAKHSHDSG